MNRGIYPVLAGAITHERHLELLAHNLGNLQTAGYKQDQPVFGTILAESVGRRVAGIDLYPETAVVRPDQTQGTLRQTGNFLDVALEGNGFFVASTPDGLRHFRGGSLRVDDQKQLVTQAGDPILGKDGPIEIRPGNMTIDKSGNVRVGKTVLGSLRIERPQGGNVPVKMGDSYWVLPGQGEDVAGLAGVKVHQGSLELSNVNPSLAMVNMIQVSRGFEQMQKAIQTMDDLTGQIIQASRLQ